MNRMKWRGSNAMERAEALRRATSDFLRRRSPNYSVGEPISSAFSSKDALKSLKENAGIQIFLDDKPIGFIRVTDLGKPDIHVSEERRVLADGLADHLKVRMGFIFRPAVKIVPDKGDLSLSGRMQRDGGSSRIGGNAE